MNLGLCASLLAPSNTTDWVSCNVFAAEHDSHLRNGEQVCSFGEEAAGAKTTQIKDHTVQASL